MALVAPQPVLIDQLPVPCLRCGAPMRLAEHDTVHCEFCGRDDHLPAELAARTAFLRRRLAEVRAARQEFSSRDRRIVQRIEGGWLAGTLKAALGPLSLILGLLVIPFTYMAATDPLLTSEQRVGGLAMGLALLIRLIAVVGAMVLGWLLVARRYRRVVRPQLLARVPAAPGSPARCRACGGPLQVHADAFAECPHCGAQNLLTDELTRERDRLLGEELASYRRRAEEAGVLVEKHGRLVSHGILFGNLAGMLLGLAFATDLAFFLAQLLVG